MHMDFDRNLWQNKMYVPDPKLVRLLFCIHICSLPIGMILKKKINNAMYMIYVNLGINKYTCIHKTKLLPSKTLSLICYLIMYI